MAVCFLCVCSRAYNRAELPTHDDDDDGHDHHQQQKEEEEEDKCVCGESSDGWTFTYTMYES